MSTSTRQQPNNGKQWQQWQIIARKAAAAANCKRNTVHLFFFWFSLICERLCLLSLLWFGRWLLLHTPTTATTTTKKKKKQQHTQQPLTAPAPVYARRSPALLGHLLTFTSAALLTV